MSFLASLLGMLPGRRRTSVSIERADSPPPYFGEATRWGIGDPINITQATLVRNHLGPQATSTNKISERIASLRWMAQRRTEDETGTEVWEEVKDHPLADLLNNPNPYYTAFQLRMVVSQWLVPMGEAMLLKVGNGMGLPTELWPLEPHLTTIEATQTGFQYRYNSSGGERVYQQDEVVRIFKPGLENPFRAEGNLAPQGLPYDTERYQTETARKHFADGATPPLFMQHTGEASPPTGDKRNMIDREWQQRHNNREGTKSGMPMWLPNGVNPVTVDRQMATTPEMLQYFEDRMYRANGVPRAIMGDVQDANRANMDSAQYGFDAFTIKPWTELISDGMTQWVATDFGEDLRVGWEPFITEDADLRLRTEAQDLQLKVRTVNEVRTARTLEPVDYGDEPIGSMGDTPYRPDEENSFTNPFDAFSSPDDTEEDQGDEDEEEEEDERTRAARSAYFSRDACYQRLIELEMNYVPVMARAYRNVLRRQASRTVRMLLESRARAEDQANLLRLNELFDEDLWRDVYRVETEPVRRDAFRRQVASTFMGFNISTDTFIWDEEVTKSLAKAARDMQLRVDGTTKRLIAQQLQIAFDEGESIEQVATRIKSVYSRRRKDARTIARTEVGRASTDATLAAHTQLRIKKHRWLTSRDEAVRESHQSVHNVVVEVGSPFKLVGPGGSELAAGPRVGQGAPMSAENAINCRCTLSPVVE